MPDVSERRFEDVTDDLTFAKYFLDWLFDRFRKASETLKTP
jgi:hypothetical protein